MSPQRLDTTTFHEAVQQLARREPRLAALLRANGEPPFWSRRPGFRTLALIILEQQVSLASARSALVRLERRIGRVGVTRVAACDEAELRAAGITRQKAAYLVGAAHAIAAGRPRLSALARLGDEAVREQLVQLRGIGAWSAEVYLLMALRRADAWPPGDLALAIALREVFELDSMPGAVELLARAEPWRPFRAVAARMLWHDYLLRRGRDLL